MIVASPTAGPVPASGRAWGGHWHGYGPWIGSPAVYAEEGGRRPAHPNVPDSTATHATRYHVAAGEFTNSEVPPLMTGHWLQKRGQSARARTWTDVTDAVKWLREQYDTKPPFERTDGGQAYVDLGVKVAYAHEVLPLGVDVTWVHYTSGQSLFSASVVCCPNHFHPDMKCPLPPS